MHHSLLHHSVDVQSKIVYHSDIRKFLFYSQRGSHVNNIREQIKDKKKIVVKIGSSSLQHNEAERSEEHTSELQSPQNLVLRGIV